MTDAGQMIELAHRVGLRPVNPPQIWPRAAGRLCTRTDDAPVLVVPEKG